MHFKEIRYHLCSVSLFTLLILQISKRAVDLPHSGKFSPEDLSSYPPRIICTLHSVKYSHVELSKSCALSMTGFDEDVLINIPLSSSSQYMPEDAHQLKVYEIIFQTYCIPRNSEFILITVHGR